MALKRPFLSYNDLEGGFEGLWNMSIEQAASQYRDGRLVSVEIVEKHVTPEFAYTLWLGHAEGKVGGREDLAPTTLRVTMIYRPEDGTWKVVHRHADSITTAQPAESLIQQ